MEIVSDYLIYGLFDPINGELRYIGRSSSGLERPKRHSHSSELVLDKAYKGNWIRSLLKKDLKPIIGIIQTFNVETDLNAAEMYWIKYFRDQGCGLVNSTDGGGGRFGYKVSEETKRKISEAQKGKPKVLTEEIRKKLSEGRKGKVAHNKGKHSSYETRLKISRIQGGKPFKDQFGNIYQTQVEAAEKIGCSQSNVWRILMGLRKTIKGFAFRYIET